MTAPTIVTQGGATFVHLDDATIIIRPLRAECAALVTVVYDSPTDATEVVAKAFVADGTGHRDASESVCASPGWHADVARHVLRGDAR